MYLLLVWLCYRHDLLVPSRARTATAWPHPLILSSLVAGVAFGIGNSAVRQENCRSLAAPPPDATRATLGPPSAFSHSLAGADHRRPPRRRRVVDAQRGRGGHRREVA